MAIYDFRGEALLIAICECQAEIRQPDEHLVDINIKTSLTLIANALKDASQSPSVNGAMALQLTYPFNSQTIFTQSYVGVSRRRVHKFMYANGQTRDGAMGRRRRSAVCGVRVSLNINNM